MFVICYGFLKNARPVKDVQVAALNLQEKDQTATASVEVPLPTLIRLPLPSHTPLLFPLDPPHLLPQVFFILHIHAL